MQRAGFLDHGFSFSPISSLCSGFLPRWPLRRRLGSPASHSLLSTHETNDANRDNIGHGTQDTIDTEYSTIPTSKNTTTRYKYIQFTTSNRRTERGKKRRKNVHIKDTLLGSPHHRHPPPVLRPRHLGRDLTYPGMSCSRRAMQRERVALSYSRDPSCRFSILQILSFSQLEKWIWLVCHHQLNQSSSELNWNGYDGRLGTHHTQPRYRHERASSS